MYSGWAAKLGTPAFTGKDAAGVFHFPGFSADAVDELIKGRRAAAIGVDTLSLDNGPSTTFAAHVKWLGADKYGVECMKNLDKIPATGATATVGVIPWQQGSGGPGARPRDLLMEHVVDAGEELPRLAFDAAHEKAVEPPAARLWPVRAAGADDLNIPRRCRLSRRFHV